MPDQASGPPDTPDTPEPPHDDVPSLDEAESRSEAPPFQEEAVGSRAAPKHLWVVGGLALLWNAIGAFDYLMTRMQNEAYMGQFSPEQIEYFTGFPTWVVFFWAIAVWGAVLGSVLLLLRKKLAAPVFLASFASMVVTSLHNFLLTNGLEVMGVRGAVFSVVVFVVALGLWLYAKGMADRGVLA